MLLFSSVCLLGVFFTLKQPKIFEAETVVVINPEPQNVNLLEGTDSQQWYFRDTYFDTQIRILQSRHVASRVVSDQNLASDPVFFGVRAGESSEKAAARISGSDPVAVLLQMLRVEALLETRLVRIKVRHQNPAMAARLADAVATAYQEQNMEHRVEALDEALTWLDTQTRNYEEKVKSSSDALNSFKNAHQVLYSNPVEQQKLTNEQLGKMQVRLLDIEADRLNAQHMLNEVKKLDGGVENLSALEILTGISSLSLLRDKYLEKQQEEEKLLVTYLEKTPQVESVREEKRLIEGAVKTAFAAARAGYQAKYDALSGLENQLRMRSQSLKDEALALDQLRLLYEQVEVQKQEQERLFEMMQRRLNEVSLSRLLDSNNIRILDRAVAPKVPVSPRVFIYLLVTFAAGILLGLLGVFIVDALDISIKSQHDVERRAGIDFLGIIPGVPRDMLGRSRSPYEYIRANARSPFAEHIRTLRTTLSFLLPPGKSQVLLVTSPSPLEGKTTTAMTLAYISALAGQRVVLLEGDLRKPRLYKGLGMERAAGLSAVALGEMKLSEVLRPTGIEGLDLLPCEKIPQNPSELFQMSLFDGVMSQLRTLYDFVIIDSPPVNIVSDALILSQHSDGVIVVVRAGKTPIPSLVRSKELLEGVRAPLFGVVINDYQSKGYGSYTYYYQEEYGDKT